MSSEKKILFVAYYYPPIKAIGSLRPYYLSKEMAASGWKVFVNTTSNRNIFTQDELPVSFLEKIQFIETFDLHKIKFIILRMHHYLRRTMYTKALRGEKNRERGADKIGGGRLRKLLDSFLINISYEGGWIYIVLSVWRSYRTVKRKKIKYIYSTFSPYSNHIIAYLLKMFCRDLIWVADFRDLPPGIARNEMYGKSLQKILNNIIFSKVDIATTVSRGLKHSLESHFKNCFVLYNGFNALQTDHENIHKTTPDFNIVYTGSLYGGKRNIEPILAALVDLVGRYEIKFVYAGKDSFIVRELFERHGLSKILVDKGVIDRGAALKLQREAGVNLMVTWASKQEKGILTGKFFEYIQAGRPILCLINGEKDEELEEIVEKCKLGAVAYGEEIGKISKFILDIYLGKKEYQYNMQEVFRYSYKNLASELSMKLLTFGSHGNGDEKT